MRGEKNIVYITHNGKTQSKADWARELNISRQAFQNRFKRFNGDMLAVCTVPIRKNRKHMYKGRHVTIREMAKMSGLSESGVYRRFGDGMSDEEIIETPRRKYTKHTTAGMKQKPIGCTYPDCEKCPYNDCAW